MRASCIGDLICTTSEHFDFLGSLHYIQATVQSVYTGCHLFCVLQLLETNASNDSDYIVSMQSMFAEPVAASSGTADASPDATTHLAQASTPLWELVLVTGLQILHTWLSVAVSYDLHAVQTSCLNALLFLASMPSPNAISTDPDAGCDLPQQQSLSQQQQHLAASLDQLKADLIAAAGRLATEPAAERVMQLMAQTGLSISAKSHCAYDSARLMQITAHFQLQYAQQAKPDNSASHQIIVLWGNLIANACTEPAQIVPTDPLRSLQLHR